VDEACFAVVVEVLVLVAQAASPSATREVHGLSPWVGQQNLPEAGVWYPQAVEDLKGTVDATVRWHSNTKLPNFVFDGLTEDEGEEGIVARVRGKEWQPTAREIEEHNVSHIPFRSWCVNCVKGKAVSAGHYKVREEGQVPKVHMDWCWMCPREEGERGMPILVVRDGRSRMIMADVVPEKGVHAFAVHRMVRILRLLVLHRFSRLSSYAPAISVFAPSCELQMHGLLSLVPHPPLSSSIARLSQPISACPSHLPPSDTSNTNPCVPSVPALPPVPCSAPHSLPSLLHN
jgi:hypothetical protein